jgi:protein TonB
MSSGPQRRKLMIALVAAGMLLLGSLGVWFIHSIATSAPAPSRKVAQDIQVIRPPPPPPDAPPPPPPPPKDEVDVPDPQQQPDPTPSNDPPPGEQLGLDAEGSGAGDGFGLMGRKGGRDLLAGAGSVFSWYAGQVKNLLLDKLSNEQKIRSGSYTVTVRVWVRTDGAIEKIVLASSSGDRDRDRIIEAVLTRLDRLAQAPPVGMPQPISLRIVSRA